MREFDFVIAGAGGAGLGLTYAMLDSPLKDCSILLIDRDAKQHNDRTWCFWGDPYTPFAWLARHSWQKLSVRSEGNARTFDLTAGGSRGQRYWMVSGLDYYQAIREKLVQRPNVQWVAGSVERIWDEPNRALVMVDGETIAARYVFDSILRPHELDIDPQRHHFLRQHFMGWEIETPRPAFDPACATWFDFSTPQQADLRFFYVLPFSETRALVEYTIFSPQLLEKEQYQATLKAYIHNQLGVETYSVQAEETGWIPMSDFPFARRAGERILNIGTKGGLVKPSTGYAFQRMQQDARAIVASLVKNGHPFEIRRAPGRYRLYDSLLLQILYRQGASMKPIFMRLFARNPISRIFHFLDEDATLFQDLSLIATLPPWPFLKALFKTKLLREI
jgi:lycopene beta-cyclase